MTVRQLSVAEWSSAWSSTDSTVLVVGTFTDDVSMVEQIRTGPDPGLLACVAAGLPEFGLRLGRAAEGVLGPVQWLSKSAVPELGPAGADRSQRYARENGEAPGYVAAQAAEAGYLAAEVHRREYRPDELTGWRTMTMLGAFALDESWRQVGHSPITVEWRRGHQEPVP